MKSLLRTLFILMCFTHSVFAQTDSISSIPHRVKRVSESSVKIKLIPRNYLELKGVGLSEITVKVTPLMYKNTPVESPASRTFIFKPAEKTQWEKVKSDSNAMICAQLLYGANMGKGNSFDQQIKSTLELQENLFVLATLGSSFSWDAAKLLNVGFELPLSADSFYSVEIAIPKNNILPINNTIQMYVGNSGSNESKIELATQSKEHGVLLTWLPLENTAAYDVYMSESADGEFSKMNPLPYNEIKNDTLTGITIVKYPIPLKENYEKRYFKVCGYDLFGETGYCSEVMMTFGRDLTPPKDIDSFTFTSLSENNAQIEWDMPEDADRELVRIYYSNNYNGPYSVLSELKKNTSNFTHNESHNILPNYYKIVTVDTANNENSTTPFLVVTKDTVAPNIITKSDYSIDQNGNIEITWNPSISPDIRGYRVATSTQENGPWVFLTPYTITDTFFRDTISLKNLRGNRFYGVKSVDLKGNFSNISSSIKIELPDKVAPAPITGIVHSLKSGDIQVEFNWPNETDLYQLHIQRMSNADSSEWIKLNDISAKYWIDTNVISGSSYSYKLKLIDKSGNESNIFRTGIKKPLPRPISAKGVTLNVEISGNNATVSWNKVPKGTKSIKLLRKSGNNPYYIVGNLSSDNKQYIDHKLKKYMSYTWAIQFKNDEGSISEMVYSDAAFIR